MGEELGGIGRNSSVTAQRCSGSLRELSSVCWQGGVQSLILWHVLSFLQAVVFEIRAVHQDYFELTITLAIDNGKMTNYNPETCFHCQRIHVSQKQGLGGAAAAVPLLLLCVVTPGPGPVIFLTFPQYLGSLSWWIFSPPHSPRGSFSCSDISFLFLSPSLGRPAWARTSPFTSLQATLLCCSTRSLDLRPRSTFWIFMTSITPWTARSASTPSSSGCGAELLEGSGDLGKAQSIQKTPPAFPAPPGGGRWLPQEGWNTLMCLPLGL